MHVHGLFATPVVRYHGFNSERELEEAVFAKMAEFPGRQNSFDPALHHWFDAADDGLLNHDDAVIQRFKEWITVNAELYVKSILGLNCEDLIVTSCWVNRCDKGGRQPAHSHENSLVSGVYYMKFEKGHAPITFYKPAASREPNAPYLSVLPLRSSGHIFMQNETTITPNESDLFLWPSHLAHSHDGNARDGRISIAMNLLPKRIIGQSYKLEVTPIVDQR